MKKDITRHDWPTVAKAVLEVEIQGLAAVQEQIGPDFVRALEYLATCKGRVVVTGLGKSGLVGRKIAATLSSTGTPSYFLHPVEGAHGDMGMIRSEDVILAISNSGETDELNSILPAIRAIGSVIISMTADPDSTLAKVSDVFVQVRVPKEACPMGLAPTASTTACLAMGDAMAVCLMEWKSFGQKDFHRFHPGGTLGNRLSLRVEDLMHRNNLPVVDRNSSVKEALEVLNIGGFGLVVAVEKGQLSGVLSDGDVRRLVCRDELDFSETISKFMTEGPRSIIVGESAAHVLDIMEKHQITVLPVIEPGGKLAGLVHLHDVLGKGRLKFAPSK